MRSTGASRDSPRHQQRAAGPDGGGTDGGTRAVTPLALLPLFDHVLLPGGFLRVTIPASWHKSNALVEELLQAQTGEVVVAAVPLLADPGQVGAGDDPQLDLDRLHSTGTAARVLQLVRRTASGSWTVTLEGRCRLRIRDVRLASRPPRGELFEALVEQLDYLPPGRPAGGRTGSTDASAEAATKEQEELSQELLKASKQGGRLHQRAERSAASPCVQPTRACRAAPAWRVCRRPLSCPAAPPLPAGHATPLPAHPGGARGPGRGRARGPGAGPAGPRPHVRRAGQPRRPHAARPPRPAVLAGRHCSPAGGQPPARSVPAGMPAVPRLPGRSPPPTTPPMQILPGTQLRLRPRCPASAPAPQLVVDLLGQMLEVAEKAAAASGRSRRGGGQPGAGRGGLRLPGLAGEEDDEEEDSGRQELAALMQKLKVGRAGQAASGTSCFVETRSVGLCGDTVCWDGRGGRVAEHCFCEASSRPCLGIQGAEFCGALLRRRPTRRPRCCERRSGSSSACSAAASSTRVRGLARSTHRPSLSATRVHAAASG